MQVGDSVSEKCDINKGIVQGSTLGPLLFLLYINDLCEHITEGYMINFADDTAIIVAANNQNELFAKINQTNNEVSEWCNINNLLLNISKTTSINFYNRKPPDYLLPNNAKTTKYLGTTIDERLTWNEQIDHVISKINSAYFAISKPRNKFNRDALLNVYYTLVHSHLTYNLLTWGGSKFLAYLLLKNE